MMPTATKHILIVEDENDLSALIADYARHAGYQAHIIADGQMALLHIKAQVPDFIVLDLMLPGLDGLSLCQEVRRFSPVPILMLTAKVEEVDRLLGLEAGADDYLCKPFSPRELMARIKAILRRSEPKDPASNPSCAVSFNVDESAQTIALKGKTLDLTRSEYLILKTFIAHPGQVFSRIQLLDHLSQDNFNVTDRAIDSHIKNLRKKLELVLPEIQAIHSIYGLGYRFDYHE
jgi:two-component system response regulator BaeR